MVNDFLIVSKKILPDYLDKVLEARQLLESNQCRSVSEAVHQAGISRSTYYKYKDFVFSPSESTGRKFILSIAVADNPGNLSMVLDILRQRNTNIVTIHQDMPIHHIAYIIITLDGSKMDCSIEQLLTELKGLDGVQSAQLIAME